MVKAGRFLVFHTIRFIQTHARNYIELLYVDFAVLKWEFLGLLTPQLPLFKPCTECMSTYSSFVNAETSGLRIEWLRWCHLTALALNWINIAACLTWLWCWINQSFIRLVSLTQNDVWNTLLTFCHLVEHTVWPSIHPSTHPPIHQILFVQNDV